MLEDRIRLDTLETAGFFAVDGSLFFQKQGQPDQVSVPVAILNACSGATFTHNHPGGAPPSLEDVLIAAEYRLGELRAVTSTLRFYLQPHRMSGWPTPGEIERLYWSNEGAAIKQVSAEVVSGNLDLRYFGFEVRHRLWQKISKASGLVYQVEKS